ncbi:MAG TPA: hypothetical protein VLJ68_03145 [Chitinophagaceae bacterium]|nr:hypothetical protein [Chitinophagaceae bacterium]
MSDIEKRLLKLESKLRIYQIAFIGLLLGTGFMFLTGFGKKPVATDLVQAKEFQVVNDNGKVLMSLKKDSTGGGRISIYNNSGVNVLMMHSAIKGGRMSITAHDGNSGIVAAITEDNHGVLNVYNKWNNRICALGGDAKGGGVLNVYDNASEKMNGIWPKE